jgi:hypothetical protein
MDVSAQCCTSQLILNSVLSHRCPAGQLLRRALKLSMYRASESFDCKARQWSSSKTRKVGTRSWILA